MHPKASNKQCSLSSVAWQCADYAEMLFLVLHPSKEKSKDVCRYTSNSAMTNKTNE